MNRLDAFKAQRLVEGLLDGMSVSALMLQLEVSSTSILSYRRVLVENGAELTCLCGRPGGHRGWCRIRLMNSESRKRFLSSWRKEAREITGGFEPVPAEEERREPEAPVQPARRRAEPAPELPNVRLAKPQDAQRRHYF